MTDLDVVARGEAWKIATDIAEPMPPPSGHGLRVVIFGGGIEVFDRWLPGTVDADELIDGAELIQGIPFCPLSAVLAWKRRSDREKDQADIKAIQDFLRL
ncbi:hypothetical protein AB0G60_06730 [Streptomyces angustmyceticus]|uniref:hypothetical protein n=1 Tax=Streptomyces angustmyceticus TaxID=285578 RepID=UPI001ABF115F|nr:hypothetical protein [Streptomyces angustmyceticus]UAL69158.1 hypothetical protein K7396_23660 [Streptomyces angustmyceticus]